MSHDELVCRRDVVLVEGRAIGRAQTRYVVHVLDPDGQSVQRGQGIATHDGGFSFAGFGQSRFGTHVAEGHQERVQRLDPVERRAHHVYR
jgi:hypothetical protein